MADDSKFPDEGKDATTMEPAHGTETHGSPASKGGLAEDTGKK